MTIDKAIEAGMLPPCGMGRIMRSVRTPMGVQHAWSYADLAWITYGNRVRMLGTVRDVRNVIEREAIANNQPATIGWEAIDATA
jgi:hypothetical protein